MTRRIFTATLGTETNTFASLPTGMRMFEDTCLYRGGNYGDPPPMFAGPLVVWRNRATERGWTTIESLCAFAAPAGITVRGVYEGFRDEILRDLKAAMPLDAVLLSLHGAMVADGYDDAEGDLIERVRELVGPDVAIGVEFDLHANVSARKIECADVVVLFKEYPHVDVNERAEEVFTLVADKLDGKTNPVMAWFDCKAVGVFHTTRDPMCAFVDKCSAMEGKDGVLSVSVIHGFPWADVADMGSKMLVVTDGDKAKAGRLARELGMEFHGFAAEAQPAYATLDQAMARAASHNQPRPLVLADVSDNAGGGASSDSTFMLQAMIDREIKDAAIAMFWDPIAVRIAFEVGIGAEVDLRLGGKLGVMSGPAIDVRAKVIGLAENATTRFGGTRKGVGRAGDMAAFDIGGIVVVCNTLRAQCSSLDCFLNVGVDPETKKVVVVKSMQHFHAAYAPVASEILYVAVPGAVAPDMFALPFKKASRDQWPFVAKPLG